MIEAEHLRRQIIRPVLEYLHPEIPYSLAAENLLMGTAAQESQLGRYLVQLGSGPARGIFQMEDATHDDINDENDLYDNFLRFRQHIDAKVDALRLPARLPFDDQDAPNLIGNLYYAAAMCRVHYYRAPGALPAAGDIPALAAYWKKIYNTHLGAGTETEFIENYHRYLLPG